jgi:antitoxin (DNA-binding transcriptional repressor) of toxin-antitoxin stability system
VREEGEVVEITDGGEVVARLVPVKRGQLTDEEIVRFIASLDELAEEISAEWPAGVSAQDAINDVRRDLGSSDYWHNQALG